MIRAWWRRRRQGPLVDEICRTCLRQLHAREAWEVVQHLDNTPEMGHVGGTYMTAYWCLAHRPANAHKADPKSLTPA